MDEVGQDMLEARCNVERHRARYWPHIDGLRALAVIAVIVFHFSAVLLPGGYLGVDIFFVISGYLITGGIWRERIEDRFSLSRFYERRVRRIMPAMLVVVIFTSVAAFLILLPVDLKDYCKSLFASLSFVANIYFWRSVSDYFAHFATEKPLLHLWSLGVEEQFYIFFPFLVMACGKWRKSFLLPLTAILVILSFAANFYALRIGAETPAFYLLPFRAWEFGVGSLLALLPCRRVPRQWIRHALGALAALLLTTGLLLNGIHHVVAALPPAVWVVVGTTLAIYLGEEGGEWFTRALSLRPLTFVGLLSYSLYLWHWPILVFTRYYLVQDRLPLLMCAVLAALTFGCAFLSWKYVEQPFRTRSMPVRKVLAFTGAGVVVVLSFSCGTLLAHGVPSRFSPEVYRLNEAVGSEYRCGLRDVFSFGAYRACMIATSKKEPDDATVALVGNSHAQMYAPLLSGILQQNGQKGILVPLNDCLPLPDFNLSETCMKQAATNLKAVQALPRVRVVILGMTYDMTRPMITPNGPVPLNEEASMFCQSLDRVIDELRKSGRAVVLIGPLATPGYDVTSLVARKKAFHIAITEPLDMSTEAFVEKNRTVLNHYSSSQDITFIRPDEAECSGGECEFFRDGGAIFADATHISQSALPLFRPVLEPPLNKVLAIADHK